MEPLTLIEYEIFFTMVKLKEKGVTHPSFTDINTTLNQRRKAMKKHELSKQAMNYHIRKLAKRPFVRKHRKHQKRALYSLVRGVFKIPQIYACITIGNDSVFSRMFCEHAGNCQLKTFSSACLKKLSATTTH